MSVPQQVVDTVVVAGGRLEATSTSPMDTGSGEREIGDTLARAMSSEGPSGSSMVSDTLLVEVVGGPGSDPVFGWSWDAWQGTGQWVGPIAVFVLTVLFAWIQRQGRAYRRQKVDVQVFGIWQPWIVQSMRENIDHIRRITSSIDLNARREKNDMYAPLLEVQFDNWLSLDRDRMMEVFIINRKGDYSVMSNELANLYDLISKFRLALNSFNELFTELRQAVIIYDEEYSFRAEKVSEMMTRFLENDAQQQAEGDGDLWKKAWTSKIFKGIITDRLEQIEKSSELLNKVYLNRHSVYVSEWIRKLSMLEDLYRKLLDTDEGFKNRSRRISQELDSLADQIELRSASMLSRGDRCFLRLR